jgi:hypothetical protein
MIGVGDTADSPGGGLEDWKIEFPSDGQGPLDEQLRGELIARAAAVVRGTSAKPPLRRSRHATTFMEPINCGPAAIVYFKVYDHPRGFDRIRRIVAGSRARGAMTGTAAVTRAGLRAPIVVMIAEEGRGGRALIATNKVDGRVLPRFLAGCDLSTRRHAVRQLGREIARFHRAGLIHGDLTPFNIFVTREEPPAFVFIDHERTRRAGIVNRGRSRLRNLVQLGRFDLDFIGRTDRMRLFVEWAEALGISRRKEWLCRLLRMIRARVAHDRGLVHVAADGRVTIREPGPS